MPRLRVAYIDDSGLWFVSPPDPPVKLSKVRYLADVDGDEISLSDDGTVIIYYKQSADRNSTIHSDLHGVNSAGGVDRALLTEVQAGGLEPARRGGWTSLDKYSLRWIPGTHTVLFSTMGEVPPSGWMAHYNLFSLNADTGSTLRLRASGKGGFAVPSPNGMKMTISQRGSISLGSIHGATIKADVITYETVLCWDITQPMIMWSSDSSRFGAIVPNGCFFNPSVEISEVPSVDIWLVDASTGEASLMGTIENFLHGTLSPTLEYVGYSRPDPANRSADELYLASVDGSFSTLLATGDSGFISFSPDGFYFSYFAKNTRGKTKVYLRSLDGNTFLVLDAEYPMYIHWVNNSQFLYVQGDDLFLGDVGGNPSVIASSPGIGFFAAVDLDFQASLN